MRKKREDIVKELKNCIWWGYAQEEVKQGIESLLDNLDLLGNPFRDAFVAFYKWEHINRLLCGNSIERKLGTFSTDLSEESYHCAITPVKAILHLDDWTQPNDADVQLCMLLCSKIEKANLLN